MNSLQSISKSLLLEVESVKELKRPNPASCLLVVEVAENSPAELAGLKAQDFLVSYDGQGLELGEVSPGALLEFYRADGSGLRVRCSNGDIGIKLARTAEAVKLGFRPEEADCDLLFELLLQGEWQTLRKLVEQALLHLNEAKFFDRLRRKVKPASSPMTALYGACLFELGQAAEGLRWMSLYRKRYADKFDAKYLALVDSYREANERSSDSPGFYSLGESWKQISGQLSDEDTQGLWILCSDQDASSLPSLQRLLSANQSLLEAADIRLLTVGAQDFKDCALEKPSLVSREGLFFGQLDDSLSLWKALNLGLSSPDPSKAKPWKPSDTDSRESGVPPWSRLNASQGGVPEKIAYLLPSCDLNGSWGQASKRDLPRGWDLHWEDTESVGQSLSLKVLALEQARELLGQSAWEKLQQQMLVKDSLENCDFYLVQGECRSDDKLALHQSGLVACRVLSESGALGAWDVYARRWFSNTALGATEREIFDIEDHISIEMENGLCRTRGMAEKFGAANYALRCLRPQMLGAAVHLLNEIASQVVSGKRYGENSLFRWRGGARVCQLMFRPLDPDSDEAVYEGVDMVIENGVLKPSRNAEACLTYFTEAAPHWNLGFGWPPKAFDSTRATYDTPSFFGLVPGTANQQDVGDLLGKQTRELSPSVFRWLLSESHRGSLTRLEASFLEGVVAKLEANTVTIGEKRFDEGSSQSELLSALGEPSLSRRFVAPPDQSFVRVEDLWIIEHPTRVGESLSCVCTFDENLLLHQCGLYWMQISPQEVKTSLEGSYGQDLLTGFVDKMPDTELALSDEAKELQLWMESTIGLVQNMARQFGRPKWLGEDLDGLSLIVGSYLWRKDIPKRSFLEEIGLPADVYLDAYEDLESYLRDPKTRVLTNQMTEGRGIGITELGAFLWLLSRLAHCSLDDLALAIDMTQVFESFRTHLRSLSL